MKCKAIVKSSISSDGLGIPAVSIYFAGCDKESFTGSFCPGCQNVEMQDPEIDIPAYYPEEIYRYVIQLITDWKQISSNVAVAFIGGEPLACYNRDCVQYISYRLSKEFPSVTTILYTWRDIKDITNQNLLPYVKYIDKCVLGDYRAELHDDSYALGSTNQVIYNFNTNSYELKKGEQDGI